MEQQEIKALKLFEALNEDNSLSQRELSKKLDISLGLVNSLLKKFIKKGYYKAVSVNKSRLKYILTPEGIVEKSLLTYRYIIFSIKFYSEARRKIKAVFENLEQRNIKKIVFFGAGEFAEIAYITSKESKLQLVGIIDEKLYGCRFLDVQICDISDLQKHPYDAIVITELERSDQLKKLLVRHGIEREKIVEVI